MEGRNGSNLQQAPSVLEQQELQNILECGIFSVSSNAAKFLRFVCARHFENPDCTVTEYDVAIHALGRRSDFDSQRDSIVRVEAHRVRKRLEEYYAGDGASHPVKIVLSRGQYAPRFVHTEPAEPQPIPAVPPAAAEPRGTGTLLRTYGWALLAAVLIAGALAAGVPRVISMRRQPLPSPPGQPVAALPGDTVRILAGLSSGEYVDRFGRRWSADEYFTGGTASEVRYYSLALADDTGIYQHARAGESFSYDIPLRPGLYEMHLMFAESAEVAILGSVGDGSRHFRVSANGTPILPPPDGRHMSQLDVVADAGGTNTADIKVLKNISPAGDGKLHLRFDGGNGRALLNAIEIVPGLKDKMHPLRWRAGDTTYIDRQGNLWLSDRYFRGGRLSRFHAVVAHTADPGLYEGERFGAFTYSIPVVAGDSYTVRLQFAENYFGGWTAPAAHPRIFSVYANHLPLLRDFDISREAGGAVTALVKTFHGIRPNTFDKIVLSFEPSTEFAIINAISVEDEAK